MGLFGKSAPVVPPKSKRQDLAAILQSAPPREMKQLSGMQPEIDYLSDLLPAEEPVLALASAAGTGMGVALGVVALTPQRLVSVLGQRAKGRAVGVPAIESFDLCRIQNLSFGSKQVPGVRGYFATFVVDGQGQVMMDIGDDDRWADAFLNAVRQQVNRARLS